MSTELPYPDPYPLLTHVDLTLSQIQVIGVKEVAKILNENVRKTHEQITYVATGAHQKLSMLESERPWLATYPTFVKLREEVEKCSKETEAYYEKIIAMCRSAEMDLRHAFPQGTIKSTATPRDHSFLGKVQEERQTRKRRTKSEMQELRAQGLEPPIRKRMKSSEQPDDLDQDVSNSAPSKGSPIQLSKPLLKPTTKQSSTLQPVPESAIESISSSSISSSSSEISDDESDREIENKPLTDLSNRSKSPRSSSPSTTSISDSDSDNSIEPITSNVIGLSKPANKASFASNVSGTKSSSTSISSSSDLSASEDEAIDRSKLLRQVAAMADAVPDDLPSSNAVSTNPSNGHIDSTLRRSSSSATANSVIPTATVHDEPARTSPVLDQAFEAANSNPTFAHLNSDDSGPDALEFDGHTAGTGNAPIEQISSRDAETTKLSNQMADSNTGRVGSGLQIPATQEDGLQHPTFVEPRETYITDLAAGNDSEHPYEPHSKDLVSFAGKASHNHGNDFSVVISSQKSLGDDSFSFSQIPPGITSGERKKQMVRSASKEQRKRAKARKAQFKAQAIGKPSAKVFSSDQADTPTPSDEHAESLMPRPSPQGPMLTQPSPTPITRNTRSRSPFKTSPTKKSPKKNIADSQIVPPKSNRKARRRKSVADSQPM